MAHWRSQGESVADDRERLSTPPPTCRHPGHRRERFVFVQNVAAPDAPCRTDQRTRPENRRQACLRAVWRRFDFAPFRLRAIHHGLGARSVLELVWRSEDAGADQAHTEDGETVEELNRRNKTMNEESPAK